MHFDELPIFFFWFLIFLPRLRAGEDGCTESRCRHGGPAIRFPFRLIDHHPEHCGYPGFELSCNNEQTVLKLPFSVEVLVKKIDYKSQVIRIYDPDGRFPRQFRNLSISTSPFRFVDDDVVEFALFNCSAPDRDGLILVSWFGNTPGFKVYALASSSNIDSNPLTSCSKIYNTAPVPVHILDKKYTSLSWLKPDCSHCEAQGKICSSNNYTKEPETVCLHNPKTRKGAIKKLLVAGVILGFFLLVLAVIALYHMYSSNKLEKENQERIRKFLEDYRALKPTRYSYADIKRITDQFSDKLGEGGYGTVFKGKLSSEILVAVKVLSNTKGNGEEFINEVAIIGRIHHVNVVRLVGYCADGFRRALVYEFLPNDSLEKFIFSSCSKSTSLGWQKLQEIALGIAKGIEYLHQGCDQRILHFDIKPHNILLDHNINPKICDFGLAKLCSKEKSAVSMTAVRGTMGYIAPEVLSRNFGKVSYKFDVYSFGMLLLEMVGGRKNNDVTVNASQGYFPEWVYNRMDQGEELRIRIEEVGDDKIVKKLTLVGLWCIQWYPVDRPSMKAVLQMLEGEGENLTMPPNPFSATNPARENAGTPGRPPQQELEVISELE